ncbi:pyrroloquinoline quinone biosynthesis protein PqqB [Carnimonas nigrificans]|uniref:pyrroloquinoline quinone biosynthesis protein PqqB n=1 Tax=Carnimonas nigrificans TaxID=64323 RepID=UPI0004AC75CF|nr:pyrroloquinoline quinone biosynthesis protein PqqB [Carnimonas nigrificans]
MVTAIRAEEATSSALQLLILGAGAGGGSPQWNCGCTVCQQVRDGVTAPRTQASVAVSVDGTRWSLIDCAPEILTQLQNVPELAPAQLRHSPIEAVVLTGGDIDHIAGLLSLREGTPFELLATGELHQTLSANSVFDVLRPDVVRRTRVESGTPFTLPGGLQATTFAVPGKAPLYQPNEAENIGAEGDTTIGVELRHAGKRLYYIPGCAHLSEALAARIRGADVVLFDGTLWRDDELIAAGLSHKSGARMGHISMSGPDGSMAALADLGIKRRIYIHINNSNPALLEQSPERHMLEEAGWEVGFDGMRVTL